MRRPCPARRGVPAHARQWLPWGHPDEGCGWRCSSCPSRVSQSWRDESLDTRRNLRRPSVPGSPSPTEYISLYWKPASRLKISCAKWAACDGRRCSGRSRSSSDGHRCQSGRPMSHPCLNDRRAASGTPWKARARKRTPAWPPPGSGVHGPGTTNGDAHRARTSTPAPESRRTVQCSTVQYSTALNAFLQREGGPARCAATMFLLQRCRVHRAMPGQGSQSALPPSLASV